MGSGQRRLANGGRPERHGVTRRALRPHRDLEGFGILLYNFDLCVVHRMLFDPTSRNVKRRPLTKRSDSRSRDHVIARVAIEARAVRGISATLASGGA